MSMYNALFGENPLASVLLVALGITEEQCGRYRNCFIEVDKIGIYTRNGGDNRYFCHNEIDFLRSHPSYLYDEDDDFDYTYATFYFSFPEEYAEELKAISVNNDFTPSEKWNMLIESLNKEANQ